ncbi:4Fe-4S dicluster domain-containing protein [Clostridiaceae bacterium DONG20-135]|uniref:4Fe-4S dicluster domain-containing protein n=1 Tax=Copranaerobaculum intestinale TaxID=2692629 RepID=A0A6N8UAW9_9FIRM|nr:4Fe-4S dicluster domain-containing protein [Copranaerobaculum intestinale]
MFRFVSACKENGLCYNRVSQKEEFRMPVTIDKDACIGCGACVGVCPVGALSMDGDGKSACDEGTCIDCGSCVGTCPVSAISQ